MADQQRMECGPCNEERRQGMAEVLTSLNQINERTVEMDIRLRTVEQKVLNGLTDRLKRIEERPWRTWPIVIAGVSTLAAAGSAIAAALL